MRLLAEIRDRIERRKDSEIILCLRDFGAMPEAELRVRTAIKLSFLQTRLERLAEHGLVASQLESTPEPRRTWRIHHSSP